MLPEDTSAKGTAKGVKPKGFAGGYRQGWISLPVIRCHKSDLPSLKDILVPLLVRSLEYSLSKGLLLLANPNGPQGRWDGRGSQAMKANLQINFGKTVWRPPSEFCHMENKREVFCLGLLHPDRIWMNHGMTSAASHPSPKLPSPKSNTGILLLAMKEGQLWPPDQGPSS